MIDEVKQYNGNGIKGEQAKIMSMSFRLLSVVLFGPNHRLEDISPTPLLW